MESIIDTFLTLFKELAMQYGLWETATALTLSIAFIVAVWRLPNIITAFKK